MNPEKQALPQPSDEELIVAVAAGEARALDVFMTRHQSSLYRFLFRATNDATLAADLAQESFVRVWFRAGHFRRDKGASVRTWLFSIALNLFRDDLRRRRRPAWGLPFSFFRRDGAAELFESVPDPALTPGVRAEAGDELDRLQVAIAGLPENLRVPLVLCALEGLSQSEAAEVLGTSRKAVELRVRRAKEKLGESLA